MANSDPLKERLTARRTRARRISLIGKEAEARRQRNVYLNFAYGITLAQYEAKLSEQDGKCAICRRPPLGKMPLHVDHDHVSGSIRDLLCRRCNSLVGFVEKHGELIPAATAYLHRFKVN